MSKNYTRGIMHSFVMVYYPQTNLKKRIISFFLKNEGSFSHFDFSFDNVIVMNLTLLFSSQHSHKLNYVIRFRSEVALCLLVRCESSHSQKELEHVP